MNEELTLEENKILYGLVDTASKAIGIQHKEQFDKLAAIGEKLVQRIKEQTNEASE